MAADDAVPAPGGEPEPAADAMPADPFGDDELAEAAARIADDLAELRRERDELLDLSRRLQADFENFRKRTTREQAENSERATVRLIERLLPVLDSFELAVGSMERSEVDEQVRKGIELVFAGLTDVLTAEGLERIDALDAPFDPNEHEAVLHDDGEAEPRVVDVLRSGWRLKGRVVRPAMVKVSREG